MDFDSMKMNLDSKVLQHSKVLEEKFGEMISSITKTFYEKIAQVTNITATFDTVTQVQVIIFCFFFVFFNSM